MLLSRQLAAQPKSDYSVRFIRHVQRAEGHRVGNSRGVTMAQEAICYSGQMQRIQISSGRCTAAICFVR